MFDLGLGKIALIATIALVVIGPSKIPGVARTVGTLFGRAQRYVNDVKAEVIREIELDALRKTKADFEQAVQDVQTSVEEHPLPGHSGPADAWGNVTRGGIHGDEKMFGTDAAEPIWNDT